MVLNDQADLRLQALRQWVAHQLQGQSFTLVAMTGDASFRRYFRVSLDHGSYVAVDASPARESEQAFVSVRNVLAAMDLHVPVVHHCDMTQGFLLLSDLGDTLLLDVLNDTSAQALYERAFAILLKMQRCQSDPAYRLPRYNRALFQKELSWFRDWFLVRKMGVVLTASDRQVLDDMFERLIQAALAQPQVLVHRDYHSRNLMLLADGELGVLDFQDAVWGPVTYDLVSLLCDAYIAWPRARVIEWVKHYHQQACLAGVLSDIPLDQFQRWFDWMGLQRHLKVVGIFSRLHLRDGKRGYVDDIPRVLGYVLEVSDQYPEFRALRQFILATDPM